MNNDWKETTLGEVIEFNPKELIKNGQLSKKIPMEILKPFKKHISSYNVEKFKSGTKFRNGDTLLARITPCLENGKTSQVTILDENEIGFGSTEYIVMRAKKGFSDKDFIFYLAISEKLRDIAIKSMVGSSGRQRAQLDVIKNIVMNIPPLAEQKAIADTLSCLDEKIELNRKMNRTLEEIAQAIFKSWFIDFEPFKDGEFEDSELGKIPKGWRVIEFEKISSVQNGYAFKSRDYCDNGCKMIRTTNIKNGYVNNNDLINLPSTFYTLEKYENFKLQAFDTVLVMVGASVGKIGLITAINTPSLQNQNMWRFRPLSSITSPVYVHYVTKLINESVKNCSSGSARDFYRKDLFKKHGVFFPTSEVMEKFNVLTLPLFELRSKNIFENEKLTKLRDYLLPKLISGEVRVPLEVE